MKHLGRLMRSASLSGYVELVRSLGRDPHAFMRSVGLQANQLEHPETLIPGDAVRELLEITARATRTEDFALRLAAQRRLSALGPISLVLKEEPTPRAALDTLSRYLKLVNASLIFRLEDAGDTVVVHEDLLPSPGLPMRQSIELAVGIVYRILGELIGPQWRPQQVCFTHRPPADASAHRAFFGRSIKFNQDFNGLVCLAADLLKPRAPGDQAEARFAREYLEAALKDRGESGRDACRELILALLPTGDCTVQTVARHLRVDRRTLHRRLQAEGLTFSDLLDEVRADLVRRHLRDSDLPLGEVAELLGFSGPSSFSHWFSNHFGCSASQWSRQAAGTAAQG
ncbi:AraC family transcriptional regulator [Variovorax sp. KBW07]|uniref:AraC family transcriptional regulator n=1 Tax=Variovorax sp. KBW07 TaxID=2153358 RepID=UPI000F563CBF|nr:AraC family transcriptional regulator [Variovorax sp. KBW07]RQO61086.1 AraC family transcriptional regulator [Variovorax sp. KBW07]